MTVQKLVQEDNEFDAKMSKLLQSRDVTGITTGGAPNDLFKDFTHANFEFDILTPAVLVIIDLTVTSGK